MENKKLEIRYVKTKTETYIEIVNDDNKKLKFTVLNREVWKLVLKNFINVEFDVDFEEDGDYNYNKIIKVGENNLVFTSEAGGNDSVVDFISEYTLVKYISDTKNKVVDWYNDLPTKDVILTIE